MEVMELRTDYEAMSPVATALFGELCQKMATKKEKIEWYFKEIVQDCQLIGIDIWNEICDL
jgi:hypothetical protein